MSEMAKQDESRDDLEELERRYRQLDSRQDAIVARFKSEVKARTWAPTLMLLSVACLYLLYVEGAIFNASSASSILEFIGILVITIIAMGSCMLGVFWWIITFLENDSIGFY